MFRSTHRNALRKERVSPFVMQKINADTLCVFLNYTLIALNLGKGN